MAKSQKMTEADLAAAVNGFIDDAKSFGSTTRDQDREWALRFFNGEVDFSPMTDYSSKVVSRDIADTHGLIMPSLMRIIFGSEQVAIYEPTREQLVQEPDPETGQPIEKDVSEDRAEQATDLINFIVMKECDGYRELRSMISDGLLLGNGIGKHWWDAKPVYQTDTYTGLDAAGKAMVLKDPAISEVEDEKEYPDPDYVAPELPPIDPMMIAAAEAGDPNALMALEMAMAVPPAPMKFDFTTKRLMAKGTVRLVAMPDEEFIIDRSATVLDETTRFAGHRQRKTRSELIEEGYKRDIVDELQAYDVTEETPERNVRNRNEWTTDTAPDKSTEYVEVVECYVLIDYDGDGIAERRQVIVAGRGDKRSVLKNVEWGDDLPFSDLVPDPRPFTWRGHGLYDKLGDVQRIKTVLLRGALDNTYQQIAPQMDMEADTYVNPDELYNPTPNGVLIRKAGKQPAVPVQKLYIAEKLMPMVDYQDQVAEKRTGISQRSQAMDMDALQNQSATAVNAAQSAAFSKIEEYARNIAEMGLKRIFRCLYRLIIKHQDMAKTIRLRGKWVEIDPTGWSSDMDVTVNTGLGTGSRDRDLSMLQGIAAKQEQAMAVLGGPTNPVLNVSHLLETYRKMAEVAGIKNADSYFPALSNEQVQKFAAEQGEQQQPDPAMLKVQAQIEADKAKATADMELEQQKAAAQLNQERERAAMQMQLEREKQAFAQQMAREEALFNAQLRREEQELEAELTRQSNTMRAFQGAQVAPDLNINPGGSM